MLRCPYCLEKVKPKLEKKDNSRVYVCPKCNAELYRDFVEKNKISRTAVGLVGFTGHGKTVYITSLFYLLKFLNRINIWQGIWKGNFSWLSLDDNTHKIIFEDIPKFEDSWLPRGTPENFPHPSLIQFSNLPFVAAAGEKFLSIYDTAGSVFEETAKITDSGRFVAHSEVVLFVVSISDCGSKPADNMESLLWKYIDGVYNKLHIDLKNQHLIVVLSKGELLFHELPDELWKFLELGSIEWYAISNPENNGSQREMLDKLRQIRENSKSVEKWLIDKNCGGFTGLAKEKFKSVEYTLVSSTGSVPVGNRLCAKLKPDDPKRVIDPLLLLLNKTRPSTIREKLFGRRT